MEQNSPIEFGNVSTEWPYTVIWFIANKIDPAHCYLLSYITCVDLSIVDTHVRMCPGAYIPILCL